MRPISTDAQAAARWGALALCLAAPPAAQAEDPVRDFNADTPGRTYSPYTVAETYFQIESDALHVVQSNNTQSWQALDPVLKYGVEHDLELQLQIGGLLNIPVAVNGRVARATGFGDITPAVKYNIYGNDQQIFAAAVIAGVKIPTATPGFGNGQVEYSIILPTQAALPLALTLQVQQEIDLLKNQADTGHHFTYAEAVSLSRSFGKVTVLVDAYAQSGTDARTPALYTADLGLAYALSPVSLVSFGAYAGLNRYAPPIEAYMSFAFRF